MLLAKSQSKKKRQKKQRNDSILRLKNSKIDAQILESFNLINMSNCKMGNAYLCINRETQNCKLK